MNLASTFTQKSVIHHHNQWLFSRNTIENGSANRVKKSLTVKTAKFKKSICGRPVLKLAASGRKHTGNSPFPQSKQRCDS